MIPQRAFWFIISLCIGTYLLGAFCIPLMDIDAAQYASISREMLEKNSFLQVYDLDHDYLDKPPMLFWLSALSMSVFGIHDWAYRLPSIIFALLAILSTYRFARIYYQKEIAQLSAMILAASQAMFLITHDVRTDTMLMGWVMLSVWQLAAWYQTNRWIHFVMAFTCVAGGMMTKGPIALVVPGVAFAIHFLLRRSWKQFFRWEYIAAVIWIALLLLPMSIGLYQQYDLHPGKMINGVPIQSGLRFYYWTQSFGRYTGENVFNEMNHFTFLLENMFWSFLPWVFLFLIGLFNQVIALIRSRFQLTNKEEWVSVGGFLLTYMMLARSQAQLPHYIFVVFPFAAIITARFVYQLFHTADFAKWRKPLLIFHGFIFAIIWLATIALMYWPFRATVPLYVPILAALCLLGFFGILSVKKLSLPHLLEISFFTIIGVNIFLSTAFYPNVLQYQMGNTAAEQLAAKKINPEKVFLYHIYTGHSMHFYAKHIFQPQHQPDSLAKGNYLVAPKDSAATLMAKYSFLQVIGEGPHFGVTKLSLPFLNPELRSQEVPDYVLLQRK